MAAMRSLVARVIGAVVVALVIGSGLYLAFLATVDMEAYSRERHQEIASVYEERAEDDSLFRRSLLTLTSSTGLTAHCGILEPVGLRGRVPAFILLGGKATGREAVRYVVDLKNVIVVALDYPYSPRDSYTLADVMHDLPEVRSALLDMVPSVMLVTDFLASHPHVDTSRIIMAGYSFGAPFVPVTMSLDRRIDAGVMAYGGGHISSLIYHNVRLYKGEVFSRVVGWMSAVLLRPIEPTRFVDRISPKPLLMVNGSEDERIPRRNVQALYNRAGDPRKLVWLPSSHVHPDNETLTRQIIGETKSALRQWGLLDESS